ncbi:uncharacterized protein F5147DRAFT_658257 [Suillus discolor]|uniref:Uncharacterized protein n=1 Tax=Suillus discolor TaxID=1912936 RepID=A0A9P7EV05_9AGAM|nr:uncharacterized protein F5147DRAFT_658257 [Suillus discolor]KAG2090127.1 hypothetical protein F5147DRAFT_658257 [Suillus discolor]
MPADCNTFMACAAADSDWQSGCTSYAYCTTNHIQCVTVWDTIDPGSSDSGVFRVQCKVMSSLSFKYYGRSPNLFARNVKPNDRHVINDSVMRNPVTSTSELTVSDIPDWAYAAFGLQFISDSRAGRGERRCWFKGETHPLVVIEAATRVSWEAGRDRFKKLGKKPAE